MFEQLWSNVKYVVMVICITFILALMIKGCQNTHKHTYEVYQTEEGYNYCSYSSTHDEYHLQDKRCPCMYPIITYINRCTGCGKLRTDRVRK